MGPGQGKGGEVEKTEATEGGMWKVGKKEKKKGKKWERKEKSRSKEPIVWQGLLVKLENKLQRTGQDEIGWKNSNTILLYSLVLRDIDTFRFNQNRGIWFKESEDKSKQKFPQDIYIIFI